MSVIEEAKDRLRNSMTTARTDYMIIKDLVKEFEQIKNRISEISKKECADYPDIKNADAFTGLWAIEQTLEGRSLACDDLHKVIKQNKAITEAAKFLVKVKRHKDTQPAQYQASMPTAWRKLEEALKNYGELEGL